MAELTIRVPDQDLPQVMAWIAEHGYEQANDEVPEWQQKLVLDRIATSKPEDYEDWEVVRERLFSRFKKGVV